MLQTRWRPAAWLVPLGATVATALLVAACASTAGDPTPAAATAASAPATTAPGALRVLVAGDSQAYTLGFNGIFGQGALKAHVVPKLAALLGCGVARGDGRYVDGTPFTPNAECQSWPDLWRKNLQEARPDISVVQLGAWEVYDRVIDGRTLVVGTPEWQQYLLGELQTGIDILSSTGKRVVLLLVPCYDGPVDLGGPPVAASPLDRVGWVNEMLRQAAARNPTTTSVIDLGELLCPAGSRLVTVNGVAVTDADQVHFTNEGAGVVWAWLAPQLRALTSSG